MKELISSEARNKVLSEAKVLIKKLTPKVVLDIYYYIGEFLAALRYGFPGLKLKVIGVTGTKGKSTTTYLITRILEEAGFRVASNSSIESRISGESESNRAHMTMPSRFRLQRFLQEAKRRECDFVVIEVTSEGLAQHRGDFIHFHIALLTNLTPEHIESHGSYENYKKAKRRLFELLDKKGIAIVNEDDKEARYFLDVHEGKSIAYSVKKSPKPLDIRLIGEFNQYNALAAYTVCRVIGVKDLVVKNVLRAITSIPGRLEEITEGQPFRVFVDYAYNTSSLETVLQTLLPMKPKNTSIVTLTGSAGGGRDRWRRPVMGKIAAQYSDKVVITSEDSYDEDPWKIIQEVREGSEEIKHAGKKVEIYAIEDRREAIKKALRIARKGDIVLIAGIGTEASIVTPKGEIPWDEREIVRNLLKHEA